MGVLGGWQGALAIQKNEKKQRNSTHSKIKFYRIFISIFFPTMDIKFFLKGHSEKCTVGGGVDFFHILLNYFINVMIKTLYISSFIVVYVIHFTHRLYSCVLMHFSFLLENYTFSARNLSSPTVFDLDA